MYVELIKYVSELLQDESEDRANHYERIADNFSIQRGTDNYRQAEYLAEQLHKNMSWGFLFSVAFGDAHGVSNDGVDGLYECMTDMHTKYIQSRSELGHHRATVFEQSLEGEPLWLKEQVAESEFSYYEGTIRNFEDDETKEYVEFLEEYVER